MANIIESIQDFGESVLSTAKKAGSKVKEFGEESGITDAAKWVNDNFTIHGNIKKAAKAVNDVIEEDVTHANDLQREAAATLPMSEEDIANLDEIERLKQEKSKAQFANLGFGRFSDKNNPLTVTPREIDAKIEEIQDRMPDYMKGDENTIEDIQSSIVSAWSKNTEHGREVTAKFEEYQQKLEDYYKGQFRKSKEAKDIITRYRNGSISSKKADELIKATFESMYGAELEERMSKAKQTYIDAAIEDNKDYYEGAKRRMENKGATNSISDVEKEYNEIYDKYYGANLNPWSNVYAPAPSAGTTGGVNKANLDPYMHATQNLILEAKSTMNQVYADKYEIGDFSKNVAYKLGSILESTATFGLSNLEDATTLNNIFKKISAAATREGISNAEAESIYNNPSSVLTDKEMLVYNAYCAKSAAQIARAKDTGLSADVANLTAEMIPFIVEVGAQTALFKGINEAASKGIAKGLARKIVTQMPRASFGRKAAVVGTKLTLNMADLGLRAGESAVMAAVLPRTYANMLNEQTKVADGDGAITITGDRLYINNMDTQTTANAFLGAWGNQWKELFTETGGSFEAVRKMLYRSSIAKTTMRMLGKTKFGHVIDAFSTGKFFDYAKNLGYHGTYKEWTEEVEGALYDYISGDKDSFKNFFGAKNQMAMLISFSLPTVVGGGVNIAQEVKYRAAYDEATRNVDGLLKKYNLGLEDLKKIQTTLYGTDTENVQEEIMRIAGETVGIPDLLTAYKRFEYLELMDSKGIEMTPEQAEEYATLANKVFVSGATGVLGDALNLADNLAKMTMSELALSTIDRDVAHERSKAVESVRNYIRNKVDSGNVRNIEESPEDKDEPEAQSTVVTNGEPIIADITLTDKDGHQTTENIRFASKEYTLNGDGSIHADSDKYRIVDSNGMIVKGEKKERYLEALNDALRAQTAQARQAEEEKAEAQQQEEEEKKQKETAEGKRKEAIRKAYESIKSPDKKLSADAPVSQRVALNITKHGEREALDRAIDAVKDFVSQRAWLPIRKAANKISSEAYYSDLDEYNDKIEAYRNVVKEFLGEESVKVLESAIKEQEGNMLVEIAKSEQKNKRNQDNSKEQTKEVAPEEQVAKQEETSAEEKVQEPVSNEEEVVAPVEEIQEEPSIPSETPVEEVQETPLSEEPAPEAIPEQEQVEPIDLRDDNILIVKPASGNGWAIVRAITDEDGKTTFETIVNRAPNNRKPNEVVGYNGKANGDRGAWKPVDKNTKLVYRQIGKDEQGKPMYAPYYLLDANEVKIDAKGRIDTRIPASEKVNTVRADAFTGVVENTPGLYVEVNGEFRPLHSKVEASVPQSAETILNMPIFQNSVISITLRDLLLNYAKHFAKDTKRDNYFVNVQEALMSRLNPQTEDEKRDITRELVKGIRSVLNAWNAFIRNSGLDDAVDVSSEESKNLLQYVRFLMYKDNSKLAEKSSLLINENGTADIFSKKNATNPIYQLVVAMHIAQQLGYVDVSFEFNIPTIEVKQVITRAKIKAMRERYTNLANGTAMPNYDLYEGDVNKEMEAIASAYPEVLKEESGDKTRLAYTQEEKKQIAKNNAAQKGEAPAVTAEDINKVEETPVAETPIEESQVDEIEYIKETEDKQKKLDELTDKLRAANEEGRAEDVESILAEMRKLTSDRPELFAAVINNIQSHSAPVQTQQEPQPEPEAEKDVEVKEEPVKEDDVNPFEGMIAELRDLVRRSRLGDRSVTPALIREKSNDVMDYIVDNGDTEEMWAEYNDAMSGNGAEFSMEDSRAAAQREHNLLVARSLVQLIHRAPGIKIHHVGSQENAKRIIREQRRNLGETDANELVQYSVVDNNDEIARLESGEKIKVYRAMQLIDGKLYPPMSAKVDGKMREPIQLGVWERAEERPDLATKDGRFKLSKGNGSSIEAAYNPYFHTSRTPLNDQFTTAYTRGNIVIVEVEVPASELTSGYKAEKAHDSVGEISWHSGPVSGKLPETRKVILSRWDKPIRIVPDAEVAQVISGMLQGTDVAVPWNVVSPNLLSELKKLNVKIGKGTGKSYKGVSSPEMQIIGETNFDKKFKKMQETLDKGGKNVLSLQEISELTDTLEDDLRQGNRPLVFERIPLEALQSGLKEQRTLAEALTIVALRSRRSNRALVRDGREVTSEEINSRDGSNTEMLLDLIQYAKDKGIWIEDVTDALDNEYGKDNRVSVVSGKSSGESEVWLTGDNVIKAKANNYYETMEEFLEGMILNNWIFADNKQKIIGFGIDRRSGKDAIRVVYETPTVNIEQSAPLTTKEKDEYMADFGFTPVESEPVHQDKKDDAAKYTNGEFTVGDLHSMNIVRDANGAIRCIDPIIRWVPGEHYQEQTEEQIEKDAENEEILDEMFDGAQEFYKSTDGVILGWAIGNEIYLTDEGLNSETPIHEYTHLWAKSLQKTNPKAWTKVVNMLKKNKSLWDAVKNDPNYQDLESDDAIASEVLSRFSGKEGARRLNELARELYKDGTKLSDKLVNTFVGRVKKALNLFWENVVRFVWNLFGGNYDAAKLDHILSTDNLSGLADMVLRDLFDGKVLDLEDAKIDKEMADIKAEAIKNGTFMKAPNGKPSNLNERLWLMTRTQNFKRWFGDWENDPENASKVLDENGEPLVVYHGAYIAGFDIFRTPKVGSRAIYTTNVRAAAAGYAAFSHDGYGKKIPTEARDVVIGADDYKAIYSLFVNLRNPMVVDFADEEGKPRHWSDYPTGQWICDLRQYGLGYKVFDSEEEARAYADKQGVVPADYELVPKTKTTDDFVREAKELGFDGCIFKNVYDGSFHLGIGMTDYAAFAPNQLKTTSNRGYFSTEDDRIEFSHSIEEIRHCDPKAIEAIKKLKGEVSKISADPNIPEGVKMSRMANIILKTSDMSHGMRAILISINAWRKLHGLPKLDGKFDIRTIFESTRSRISNTVLKMNLQQAKELDRVVEKWKKIIENSDFYKVHKQEVGGKYPAELTPEMFLERYLQARNNWERAKEGNPRGLAEFEQRMGISVYGFVEAFHDVFASTENGEKNIIELWDAIKAMTDFALDTNYRTGLISAETRDRLKAKKFYIPQRGFWDDVNPEKEKLEKDKDGNEQIIVDTSRRGRAKNKLDSMHKAEGGKSLAEGGLAYIYRDAEEAISMGEANVAKLALFNLLRENPEWCHELGFEVPKEISFYTKEDGTFGVLQDDFTEEQIKEMRKKMTEVKKRIAELQKEYANAETDEEREDIQGEIDYQYEQMPYFDEKDTYRIMHSESAKNRAIIPVYNNGVLCKITMPPSMLLTADAYNGRRNRDGEFAQAVAASAWVSAQLTMNNITFAPVNKVRDVPFVIVKGTAEYGPMFTLRFLKNFALSKGVVFKYLASAQYKNEYYIEDSDRGELFRDFLDFGGNTGFFTLPELQEYRRRVKHIEEKTHALSSGVADFRILAHAAQVLNEYTEMITRFSIYRSIIEMGLGREEAVKASLNLSLNFNRRGLGHWFFNFFNSLTVFSNATIQGAMGGWRTFSAEGGTRKKAKKVASAITTMALIPAFLGFLNTLLVPDDDDDEIQLSDYTRYNYIILPFGVRIHLNEFLRPFWGIGVSAAQIARGQKKPVDALDCWFTSALIYWTPLPQNLLTAITTLAHGEPMQAVRDLFTPTPLVQVGQIADNKNFLGGKLRYDFGETPEYVTSADESKLMRDISYGWFCMSGGDKDLDISVDRWGNEMGELRDVNPKEIKSMMFLVPSGTLDLATLGWALGADVVDKATGNYTETNVREKDIPFANKFWQPSNKNTFRYGVLKRGRELVKIHDERIKEYNKIIESSSDILSSETATERQKARAERAKAKATKKLAEEMSDTQAEAIKELLSIKGEADINKLSRELLQTQKQFKRLHPNINYTSIDDADEFIIQNILFNLKLRDGLDPNKENPQWLDWFDKNIRLPLKDKVNPSQTISFSEDGNLVTVRKIDDGKFADGEFVDKYERIVGNESPEEISKEQYDEIRKEKSGDNASTIPTILWNGYKGHTKDHKRFFRKSLDDRGIYERVGDEWVRIDQ